MSSAASGPAWTGAFSEQVCWPCGGAADPACAMLVTLVGDARKSLEAPGRDIERKNKVWQVTVPIPRCRACRARARTSAVTMVLGMALGAAGLGGTYWMTGPNAGRAPWFVWVTPYLTVALLTFGGAFAGALLGIFVLVWSAPGRRRSLVAYPPIAALMEGGWAWPETD